MKKKRTKRQLANSLLAAAVRTKQLHLVRQAENLSQGSTQCCGASSPAHWIQIHRVLVGGHFVRAHVHEVTP